MKTNTAWFTYIGIFIILTAFIAFMLVAFMLISNHLDDRTTYNKAIALWNADMWVDDGISYYLSWENKMKFYNPKEKSPCTKNISVNNTAVTDISNDISQNLDIKNNSDVLREDQWVINRECTIYSQWLPNKMEAQFSITSLSPLDSLYQWKLDENGFYNIGIIYDNENKWYFFTKSMIGESSISINLDYNFTELNGLDYLNIYDEEKFPKDKILNLKKENKELNKQNLLEALWDNLTITPWKLEIGVMAFDGIFDSNGFSIDPNTWIVIESDAFIDSLSQWTSRHRLVCDYQNLNCRLKWIKLEDGKIYLLYLKSFDKTTTYHIDFFDNFGSSLFIPTDKLYLRSFWYSDGQIEPKETYYDLSQLGWAFSSFNSSIYNYVFYSNN